MTWPIIFLLVVLKIPVVYLCAVIWWAIKAEPRPEAPAALVLSGDPDVLGPTWSRERRGRRRPPRGPARRPDSRSAPIRAELRR
jgi:hypothetical protein